MNKFVVLLWILLRSPREREWHLNLVLISGRLFSSTGSMFVWLRSDKNIAFDPAEGAHAYPGDLLLEGPVRQALIMRLHRVDPGHPSRDLLKIGPKCPNIVHVCLH